MAIQHHLEDPCPEGRVATVGAGAFQDLEEGILRQIARLNPGQTLSPTALALAAWLALSAALHERNAVWRTRVALWTDVVAKSPNKSRAHQNLGQALALAGDRQRAIEEYGIALSSYPPGQDQGKLQVMRYLGVSLLDAGRPADAAAVLEGAVALAPDDAELVTALARSLLEKGDLVAADTPARRAVALSPHDGEPHGILGRVLFGQGNFRAALEEMTVASALDPSNSLRIYNQALVEEYLALRSRACLTWNRYLETRPSAAREAEVRQRLASMRCGP